MHRPVALVANAFYVVAAMVGLPSAISFLFFGFAAIRLHLLSPVPNHAPSSRSSDTLVRLIEIVGSVIGGAFRMVGSAGQFIVNAVVAVSFVLLIGAGAMYFIGRGLHAHQLWARIVGLLVLLGFFLCSTLAALSFRRVLFPLFGAVVAASVYGIWALWRRFS